jgi:hypothetical protein
MEIASCLLSARQQAPCTLGADSIVIDIYYRDRRVHFQRVSKRRCTLNAPK